MNFIKNIEKTDIGSCEEADSFLQSAQWGKFKSHFGWTKAAFLIDWEGFETRSFLILSRRLAPGFSFAYIPWGPELPSEFPEENRIPALCELAKKLKTSLKHNTVFLRFDPPWYNHSQFKDEEKKFTEHGLKRAAATVQAPDTVIINLDLPAEEILAGMKPKWRYNISLNEKKNVTVEEAGARGLEIFYCLLQETSRRDGISIHNFNYYKTLFETYEEEKEASLHLYTASHEGQILAVIVVLFRKNFATYLYGASSNNKRNLMAPYALQWRAMQDAKKAGCKYYDLFGIPPDEDPNHPMAGLYRFKTGFGGQIIHRPGSWDYPYKSVFYKLFFIAEAFRKKLRNRKKKMFTQ